MVFSSASVGDLTNLTNTIVTSLIVSTMAQSEALNHLSFLPPALHMLSCCQDGVFVTICWSTNGFVSLITEQTPTKTCGDVLIKVPISVTYLFDLLLLRGLFI